MKSNLTPAVIPAKSGICQAEYTFYQLRIGGPEISSQNGQAGQGVIQTKKMILLK
jgi:hypothetical protein